MIFDRRQYLRLGVGAVFCALIAGCTAPSEGSANQESGKTTVYVIGTIHSNHVGSEKYSLKILETAIRKAGPDQILAEIPPDRLAEAWRGFRQDGVVSEPRVRIFPEYRDVIFPLTRKLPFEIIPTAGWTQKLADDRRKALGVISSDSARSAEWKAHQQAQRSFGKAVGSRADDPLFIHSQAYDNLVEKAQKPYEQYFENDLGAGGWKSINAAHIRLINKALDRISGQEKTVVITFGAWHKYMILKDLEKRKDVLLLESRSLFQ